MKHLTTLADLALLGAGELVTPLTRIADSDYWTPLPELTDGAFLREAREALGLTIAQAARLTGVSHTALRNAENGIRFTDDLALRIWPTFFELNQELLAYRTPEVLLRLEGAVIVATERLRLADVKKED